MDKIFNAYFTTKENNNGTGVGLYMAKNIIEKNMNGSLTAKNIENGVMFRIKLNCIQLQKILKQIQKKIYDFEPF